jgi:hypothetical protein
MQINNFIKTEGLQGLSKVNDTTGVISLDVLEAGYLCLHLHIKQGIYSVRPVK